MIEQDFISPQDGSVVIGGVVIPRLVAEEVRRLGMPLASYSAYDLELARQSCMVDCQLVDEPGGDNFYDMLELTDDEKNQQNRMISRSPDALHRPAYSTEESFCDRLEAEQAHLQEMSFEN